MTASDYMIVGEPVLLNTLHCKLPLFLVSIYIFWSLNCNMNGLRHKYFSVEVVFYKYSVTKQMLLSVAKNNWNGNFSDFIDLQGKKQV